MSAGRVDQTSTHDEHPQQMIKALVPRVMPHLAGKTSEIIW